MVSVSLALTLVIAPSMISAPERFFGVMEQAQEFEIAGMAGLPVGMAASFGYRKPNFFRANFSGRGFKVEILKGPEGTFSIDHLNKTYDEGPATPGFGGFPKWTTDNVNQLPLALFSLAVLKKEIKDWKIVGKVKVGEVDCEAFEGKLGRDTFTFSVDSQGVPHRIRHAGVNEFGPFDNVWTFVKPSLSLSQPIVAKVPLGYDYRTIPDLHYPLIAGSGVDYTVPLVDARSGNAFKWTTDVGNKAAAVIVTTADCAPSKAAEPAFRALRAEFEKNGAKVYEVVIGSQKPDLNGKDPARPVLWDRDGAFAKAWDPPVTPYIFLVDKNQKVLSAWAGYAPDQEKQLVQNLVQRLTRK